MHVHLNKCVNCKTEIVLPSAIDVICNYPREIHSASGKDEIKHGEVCLNCLSIHLQKLYSKRINKND